MLFPYTSASSLNLCARRMIEEGISVCISRRVCVRMHPAPYVHLPSPPHTHTKQPTTESAPVEEPGQEGSEPRGGDGLGRRQLVLSFLVVVVID